MTMKPVGLLGGSFDPVHFGHLRLAMECLQTIRLSKIIFMPLNSPPHRGDLTANPHQRIEMLKLAMNKIENLEVSDIEIIRAGTSYTIDTLGELQKIYINQPICLILGMDAFQNLHTWKDWGHIPDYAHIIIADRPDTKLMLNNEKIDTFYKSRLTSRTEELHTSLAGKIIKLEMPVMEISSSNIRSLLINNKHVNFLTPDTVLSYIKQEKIYLTQD